MCSTKSHRYGNPYHKTTADARPFGGSCEFVTCGTPYTYVALETTPACSMVAARDYVVITMVKLMPRLLQIKVTVGGAGSRGTQLAPKVHFG